MNEQKLDWEFKQGTNPHHERQFYENFPDTEKADYIVSSGLPVWRLGRQARSARKALVTRKCLQDSVRTLSRNCRGELLRNWDRPWRRTEKMADVALTAISVAFSPMWMLERESRDRNGHEARRKQWELSLPESMQ